MPDYSRYPNATDIENKLKSASFWPSDSDTNKVLLAREQAAIGANLAVAEWENLTGWKPFLSISSTPQTRYYHGTDENGFLNLRTGLLTLTGVTLDSTARVLSGGSQNVWATPVNAAADGEPYTELDFGGYITHRNNRIAVTGRWGYCTEVPADVWARLQEVGALFALTSVENLQSIASLGQDGFNKAWDIVGIITQKDLLNTWAKEFMRKVQDYSRGIA
jgi:hypothetical protein